MPLLCRFLLCQSFSALIAESTEFGCAKNLIHVIEPERINAFAWVSTIVVTQRKSGKIRMCVDLREPNKTVITDSFPLPDLDELLSAL